MKVHPGKVAVEESVFEPIGLAIEEDVSSGFEFGKVRILVRGVGHAEVDVDDRLGRQARDRGGAGVLQPHHPVAERRGDPGGLAPEELEHKFILAVIATSLVFWLVLGVLTGAFFKRYANEAGATA